MPSGPNLPALSFDYAVQITQRPATTRGSVAAGRKVYAFENRPDVKDKVLVLDKTGRRLDYAEKGLLSIAFHPDFDQRLGLRLRPEQQEPVTRAASSGIGEAFDDSKELTPCPSTIPRPTTTAASSPSVPTATLRLDGRRRKIRDTYGTGRTPTRCSRRSSA
jgi:hypothetical protein